MTRYRVRLNPGADASAAWGLVAVVWFIIFMALFLGFGIDGAGHHHRFESEGWIILVLWLAPYLIGALGYAVSETFTIERVFTPTRDKLAKMEAQSKELERRAGL